MNGYQKYLHLKTLCNLTFFSPNYSFIKNVYNIDFCSQKVFHNSYFYSLQALWQGKKDVIIPKNYQSVGESKNISLFDFHIWIFFHLFLCLILSCFPF